MAKKFLDILGEAFEEDVLDDVIPQNQTRKPARQSNVSTLDVGKEGSGSNSLLDTMEEALGNQVFDELFPSRSTWEAKKAGTFDPTKQESRFSTMITTEVLERARKIAIAKGIRVKDVINIALKVYVEREV
ncbi:hypothetical protein [Pontibacter sp. G13]|uniref:hypothetical protein n=1 Tax=Pontibacter sp. G13 TaxID=3074898 RepID=UPI00288C0169|nr:hypothetical protein [Pontibacter sp. G13]WNJ21336.1 hypothetical protein RJD25_12775 [Pontibacter sp. G13]